MDPKTDEPTGQTTPDEQPPVVRLDSYADQLVMPQEDDPAGDGHMWSGKAASPEDRSDEDDLEVGAPGHIPTHLAGPTQF